MGGGGNPGVPQLDENFITDPNDPRIRSFDTSGQKQSLMRDYARAGGAARAQTLASQAQALGGSRSTGTAGQLADIAAQQSYGQQRGLNDLAMQEYGQRLSMLDMLNNIKQAANAARTDRFNMIVGRNDANAAQSQQDIGNIFKLWSAGAKGVIGGA